MSSTTTVLQVLRTQLLLFFDELIALLPKEQDFLVMRFFIKDQVPIADVMEYIVHKLIPLQSFITAKDERFFLEHQVLFEDLREHGSRVNYFKDLWKQLDAENKEVFWNWFQYFLNLGKRYESLKVNGEGGALTRA
jgi:hypothetical protein